MNVRPLRWGADLMMTDFERPKDKRRSARSRVRISGRYVSDSLVVDGVVTGGG